MSLAKLIPLYIKSALQGMALENIKKNKDTNDENVLLNEIQIEDYINNNMFQYKI